MLLLYESPSAFAQHLMLNSSVLTITLKQAAYVCFILLQIKKQRQQSLILQQS